MSRIKLNRSDEEQHGWVYLEVDGKLLATIEPYGNNVAITIHSKSLAKQKVTVELE